MLNSPAARQRTPSIRIDDTPERRGPSIRRQPRDVAVAQPAAEEAADLYYRRPPKALLYRHFDSAAAAARFIAENLTAAQIAGAVLQVGESRFEGAAVAALVQRLGAATAPARKKLDA